MVSNPCCMPLKVGVKIITHLSMALAIAVGVIGIRLISISLEVASNTTLLQQEHQQPNFPPSQYGENGPFWKSDLMIKDSFPGLPPPSDDEVELFFSTKYNKNLHIRRPRDFMVEYSKVMLVCGLLAVCAVIFQFFCSCLLLCFINFEGKATSQIWVAVNCSIIFCLVTCLALFLCEGHSLPAYSTDEKLFLVLLATDILLSTYFLWIVMAFI